MCSAQYSPDISLFSVKNIFFFQAMEQGAIKRNNNAEV